MTDQKTEKSGGGPLPEDHREINPRTGQQKAYAVLTEEERSKGFVRPVRMSYVHVGVLPTYPLRDLTPEEVARHGPGYEGGKFEEYPESERPMVGRAWKASQLRGGCNGVTTMSQDIAETYARDPQFYRGTFCVHCCEHFPVGAQGEFVWEGTTERVGT